MSLTFKENTKPSSMFISEKPRLLKSMSVWPVETSLLSMAGHCHLSLCSFFISLLYNKLIQSMRMVRGRFVKQHCWLTSTWRSRAGFSLLIAKETKSLVVCVPRCLIMINDQGCQGPETRTKQLSLCSPEQDNSLVLLQFSHVIRIELNILHSIAHKIIIVKKMCQEWQKLIFII